MAHYKKNEKILDHVKKIMRLKHYSIHTERVYCDWIKQFINKRGQVQIKRRELVDLWIGVIKGGCLICNSPGFLIDFLIMST